MNYLEEQHIWWGARGQVMSDNFWLSIEKVRRILGDRFVYLSDDEVREIRDEMIMFWMIMLEN